MVREWNQAGKTDSEYKENNANARAQSSNSQDVSLEDDLQEKMKETMKKRMPMTA